MVIVLTCPNGIFYISICNEKDEGFDTQQQRDIKKVFDASRYFKAR
jgi:hypothetical protein